MLAASSTSAVSSSTHERDADTALAVLGIDHDVFDECVHEPVPQDVDEADKAIWSRATTQPRL